MAFHNAEDARSNASLNSAVCRKSDGTVSHSSHKEIVKPYTFFRRAISTNGSNGTYGGNLPGLHAWCPAPLAQRYCSSRLFG
ncbi:glycolipid 2-alpha-mannosyltransferase [Colletotrichum scovillei]|uniref:Glycolipid 2-alpha-mannosyltransferase n=1 Tax=Colletotrichum scovillei TaxID=1209932 RepID=A0A9P7R8I6_9PEZI|nr:glycolipid 2-alpha-mannosyltransferase [Colletotrichum scovillei]KAG7069604.1 glycolipid 2-alpha-mannosyltransferase [Colletotrichum scovillei]KAG7073606.1 glycolipid 2-alpha-mannosyltransferase [Colletotrichum scovillei]